MSKSKVVRKIAPIAALAAVPLLGPAAGAALGIGLPSGAAGGLGAATAGGLAKVGGTLAATAGGLSSALGPVGKTLSAVSGAQSLLGGQPDINIGMPGQPGAPPISQEEPFTPTRPTALDRPGSLSELSAFSPEQERTALATKGINVGLGEQEQDYYENLLQRSLIGEGGQITAPNDFIAPIESQYFSQQGVPTGTGIMEFLRAIRG